MIESGKHYFLSRPRRFGKSLFLSTLKEIFKGNKALFKGCAIYESDYDWKPHPILHFDFSEILNESAQDLKESLKRTLAAIATDHETRVEIPSAQEGLKYLIKALSKEQRVAVLVDEYVRHEAPRRKRSQKRDRVAFKPYCQSGGASLVTETC